MKKYCLLLIALLALGACDDFLSIKPKAEIVEHVFFENADGFEDALYGVYATLSASELYGENLSWGLVDAFAQYYTRNSLDTRARYILTLEHEQLRGSYNMIWNKAYQAIGYVNNIIRNLDQTDTVAIRRYNLYRGEALGLRAYLHFDLVRLFAPHIASQPNAEAIPYVTIYEAMTSPFKTVSQVYDLVIKDLKEAEELLAQDEEFMVYPRKFVIDDRFTTCREIHFNLYAVQATLARVYWMMGDMSNAYTYAKKVIDSQKFPFEEGIKLRNFMAGVISDKETIWGLYSTGLLNGVKKSFYTFEATYTWLPSSEMEALYSVDQTEGLDMRLAEWYHPLIGDNEGDHLTRVMKVVPEDKIRTPEEYEANGIEGMSMIRIPEMYLIAAEALLDTDPEQAQTYFDDFVASRGLFRYEAKANPVRVTMEDILKERRKEFVQEGQYFYTLKRNNMDIYVDPIRTTLTASDQLYTLTIPDDEYEYRYSETELQEEQK